MAPKRNGTLNSLSTSDSLSPNHPPSSPGLARSTSPSMGFTQFLSKPTKWFTRSASTGKVPSMPSEPKLSSSSSSSGSRKHKISRPTDPRPILEVYGNNASSRSVLDLSARSQNSFDMPRFPHPPSNPSSPTIPSSSGGGGLGDLRNISKRGWSKSADDLSKTSPPISFSPVKSSFQDRVAEYRSRSDSLASAQSAGSPTSPSPGARHPFPTLATTPPSSSSPPNQAPPRSSTLPSLSVSASTPTLEDTGAQSPQNLAPTHVHTRSHSFTPKLPSKLATPTYPNSPTSRVPSSPSLDAHPQSARAGGYGFGGGLTSAPLEMMSHNSPPKSAGALSSSPVLHSSLHQQNQFNRPTTILSPPAIVEPSSDTRDERERKRSSQILAHSGFINRLTDVPSNFHQTNLQLSKGWKSYKMELKGSKLHFYKPPSDRANAIKDLFPTGLVPPSQEDAEEEAESPVDGKKAKGKEDGGAGVGGGGARGRMKRAYWGRKTHPDLVQDADGNILKGTFEALVHEVVFATTFGDDEVENPEKPEDEDGGSSPLEEWKEFATTVIFALPSVVGRPTFEQEFSRCCSYLISGAEEEEVEDEKRRVAWLANEYLRHHGGPVDKAAWVEWKKETIPDIDLGAEDFGTTSSGLPSSSSTQALYQSSPLLDGSPEFTTFSPRPENAGRFVPLVEALNALSSNPYASGGYSSGRIPWHTLQEEGLTRELLLQIDPHLLAQSLSLYHRSLLEQSPANLTASHLLPPSDDHASTTLDGAELAPSFFGTDDHPHWLTKLILLQIFEGSAMAAGASQGQTVLSPVGRRSEDRLGGGQQQPQSSTSRTHSRSEIISVWAKVGEVCRRSGDECSWKAIAAALCARPVSRLEKAWRRVDPQALAAVESWVYPTTSRSGERVPLSVNDPQVTVWGGDLKVRIANEVNKARGESGQDEMVSVEAFKKAKDLFDSFRQFYGLCPRNVMVDEDGVTADVRRMVAFWRDCGEGGRTSGMGIKFQRIEQFMPLSLAMESRRKGLFEPFFWRQQSAHQGGHYSSLIPILFPEPLPTHTLIDRSQIVRSRADSDAIEMHQYSRTNSGDSRMGNNTLHRLDVNQDFTKRLVLGQTGPVISLNGELLLMVQPGGLEAIPSSRPSSSMTTDSGVVGGVAGEKTSVSRAPSIRVKPSTSHDLARKTSMARRSSLPSVSHRQQNQATNYVIPEHSSDPPLRVIVQAGALDNLVSVLAFGLGHITVSVADDNGEMALKEGMTRELVVDRVEYARVWWSSFRAFVTPLVFFELLRKLYITAQPVGSSPTAEEYLEVAGRRNDVLSTMKEWILTGGGAQDLLDDAALYASVESFLDSPTDHMLHKGLAFEELDVQQAWKGVDEGRQGLKVAFASQTRRPTLNQRVHAGTRGGSALNGTRGKQVSAPREPPDLDKMDPEEFVDNIDGMAFAAFGNVTEEDLYITADLLEVQTSDKIGWFSSREPASTDEATEIQCLYSHVQEVEPSTQIPESSQDVLYRLLPPGVRSCIRAFAIIRKWLISKIVAPRLGVRQRMARIELLLQVIEVARLRNAENPGSANAASAMLQPCVRSFVEAVVASALLSVESRLHHRAWQSVAMNRGCQCDSLASLLMRPYVQSTTSKDPLTIDVGWLLERMLEVIAGPDVLESSSQEGQQLVNFDKRRHLHNLISKAWALPASRKHPLTEEANRRGFERLNNIEKEVYHLQFDPRGIKEEANREAMQAGSNGPPSSKKTVRPFYKTVALQVEKNRRDKNLRSRLQREKVMEQSRHERRDDLLNRAMKGPRASKPGVNTAPKQHRNKKSMSAFLNFMRPISSAFGADIIPQSFGSSVVRKTPEELDFVPSGKPAFVVSILDARVAQFINNERSYMFQLETEDGGHYLLQAVNKKEMTKWLEVISKVTQSVAQRRLTYLGASPKPQISDHIHDRAAGPSNDPLAVFGVELEYLLQRESLGGDIAPGTVPHIIEECLNEIETRGLTEVGIYRIAGATSEINSLKEAYNRGESPVTPCTDIHAVCDLVKSWFRVLPEPVFPPDSYYEVMDAMRIENLDERLANIRSVVQRLPQSNFDLLRRVAEHLDRVTECEEHNHMTADALAIVFSPNLLRAPQNNFAMILNNMGLSHKLVKAFITHFHLIFDDADPEAEIHSEDEYEAPIPEEDEEEYDEYEADQFPPREPLQNDSSADFLPQDEVHYTQTGQAVAS